MPSPHRDSLALALAACLSALAPAARGGGRAPDGLRERVDALVGRVLEEAPERWPAIAQDLAALGPDAVAPCVQRLVEGCGGDGAATGPAQAQVLLDALLRLPRPALREHFEYIVRHPTGTCEKLVGLELLARMGQAADVLLATRLAAPEPGVARIEPRLRAAYGLALEGILGREPPDAAAFAQAYGEVHGGLTASLVRALGRSPDEASLAVFARLLGRGAAADALLLIEIGRHARHVRLPVDEDVLARVRGSLDSAPDGVVVEAVLALGALGDTTSVPRLIELAGGARPAPARAAEKVLPRLCGADHGPGAEAWREWHASEEQWWRDEAPWLLARLGERDALEVAPALRELAQHPLWRDGIAPHLAAAIARPEIELALLACAVAARLGSPLAAPALEQALEAPDARLRREARSALERLRGRDPKNDSWTRGELPLR